MESFARDAVAGGGVGRRPKCRKGNTECVGFRACRSCMTDYKREWRKRHPLTGEAAQKATARAVAGVNFRRGKLAAEPCKCGSYDVEMHHPDYSHPLHVIWLCRPCHMALHKEEKG